MYFKSLLLFLGGGLIGGGIVHFYKGEGSTLSNSSFDGAAESVGTKKLRSLAKLPKASPNNLAIHSKSLSEPMPLNPYDVLASISDSSNLETTSLKLALINEWGKKSPQAAITYLEWN